MGENTLMRRWCLTQRHEHLCLSPFRAASLCSSTSLGIASPAFRFFGRACGCVLLAVFVSRCVAFLAALPFSFVVSSCTTSASASFASVFFPIPLAVRVVAILTFSDTPSSPLLLFAFLCALQDFTTSLVRIIYIATK